MKLLTALAIIVVVVIATPAPSRGVETLLEPTDRPVVDAFRPPDGPYGAGNRGIEYGTEVGDRIVAAAAGEVVFAGPVAGDLFVTIEHGSGLRSTYAYLDSMLVRVGSRLRRGALVGTARPGFHFTIRDGETYLDPASMIGEVRVRVRLVSAADRGQLASSTSSAPRAVFVRGVDRVGFPAVPVR